VTCPRCRTPYTLLDTQLGKPVRCSNCQEVFRAPTAVRPTPPEARVAPQGPPPRRERSAYPVAAVAGVVLAVCVGAGLGGGLAYWVLARQAPAQVARDGQQAAVADKRPPEPAVALAPSPATTREEPAADPPGAAPAPDQQPAEAGKDGAPEPAVPPLRPPTVPAEPPAPDPPAATPAPEKPAPEKSAPPPAPPPGTRARPAPPTRPAPGETKTSPRLTTAKEWYSPREADFRPEYNRDAANRELEPWPEYWSWITQFYRGNLLSRGWTAEGRGLIERVRSEQTRGELRAMLNDLGRKVAAEWAKHKSVRKINTGDLLTSGQRLQAAKRRDDGSGRAIREAIAATATEVEDKLAGR
jgi:predicted Zn finger-like uncharacterized protein